MATIAVVGVAAAILANLTGSEPAVTAESARDRLAPSDTGTSTDGASGAAATPTSTGALDATSESKPSARVKVTDIPKPPATKLPSDDTPLPPTWEQYMAETREIVQANRPDLAAIAAKITQALSDGDESTLGSLLAPDEGAQGAYIAGLADRYPTILESQPGANVNVFTSDGATVYFAYSVVRWTDAGLISEHTIPIMLRFVNGQWYLTTLGDTGSDLQFVQSIQL